MKRSAKIIMGLVAGGIGLASVSAVIASERMANHKEVLMASGYEHGHGKRGKRHMMKGVTKLFEEHDLNKDGSVTQAEVDTVRKSQLDKYDQNKDGTLSLGEFESLWAERMKPRMVDGFQRLDEDGSGSVTTDEFLAPFSKIIDRHDTDDDGDVDEDELKKHMKSRWGWNRNKDDS